MLDQAFTEGPLNMTAHRSPEIDEIVDDNVPNTFSGSTLTVMATRDGVQNLDGWTFPNDGPEGSGAPSAQVMRGHVWTME